MATLTGQSIASSYEQLLHIDNDGGGDGTTHVSVKDGDNGTTFSFTIATDALMMTSTNRLEFGDTGTYINQSSDGVLNITSDTEVEINATTIDINGAVAMNGAITGGTNITISGELDAATLDISGNTDIDGTIDVAGASTFGSTITAGSLGADTDNTVVVVNSSGLLKTDEIDSRVWGSTLVDTDASGANNELATWSDANTIIGEGNLTFDGTDLLIAGGGKAAFRDNGGEYIYSVSDGTLGIAAGTEIDLTATNIDINGAVDISGNLVVGGNFTVNGTTTTINSTVMQVDDKMIELAHSPSGSEGDDAAVDGGGITLKSSDSDKTILWENDDDSWHFNQGLVIGINDTGADVRVYSATTNEGLFYDSSEDEFGLLLTTKLKFHDIGGGEEIYASANGHLEINAGTTLDITAPTVDLNSATEFNIDTAAYDLNASGAVTIDGAGISIDGTDDANFTVTGSGKDILLYATGGGAQQIQIVSAGTGSDAIELDAQEGGITFGLGGGAGDDFIVNSTTLVVESDNSRVGIGTASPSVTLDVSGAFGVSGAVGLASSSGVTTIGSSNGLTVSAAGVLTVNSATDASSSTSGSTIIDGGVGIAKKLYVGTILNNATAANLATASGITTIGSSTALTVSAAGVLTVNSTTDATNSTSGSTIIDGGVGIAKKLYVGTDLDVDGTANLDIVDIDGAVNMAADLTMGANILMADDTSIGIADDAERIEFDGAGDISFLGCDVGIGTSAPSSYDSAQDDFVIAGTGNRGMSIISATDSNSTIAFGDGTGAAGYRGMIAYLNDGDDMTFRTEATERMRINNDGNLGIGDNDPSEAKLSITGVASGDYGIKIDQDQATAGLFIDQDGAAQAILIDTEQSVNAIEVACKYGIYIDQDTSGGRAAYFTRDLGETGSSPLVTILDNNTTNTQPALNVTQDGAGYGISIDQNGNNNAIYIDTEATTTHGIHFDNPTQTSGNIIQITNAEGLTTGAALQIDSGSASLATTVGGGIIEVMHDANSGSNVNNLMYLGNYHASSTGTTLLSLDQDSTGSALTAIGAAGSGSASGAVIKLQTAETTVVDGDYLGRIEFSAPSEASGTDAILAGAAIWAEADDTFAADNNSTELVFGTNTSAAYTERMRIDSSGRIGIGTAAPNNNLEIFNAGQSVVRIDGVDAYISGIKLRNNYSSTQSDWNLAASGGTSGWGGTNGNFIIRDDTTNSTGIEIEQGAGGATGALYIDANGLVGLGTASPSDYHADADNLVIYSSGNTGITIAAGTGNDSAIYMADGTSGDAEYRGYINYDHNVDTLAIAAAAGERLKLDANSRISLSNNDSGTDNTVFGFLAGAAGMSGGTDNVLIGDYAGNALTSGDQNTIVGADAAKLLTTGSANVAIGFGALDAADGGEGFNVAIGNTAMSAVDEGSNNSDDNVAIGSDALLGGTGQVQHNVVIGASAMNSTGSNAQTGTVAIGSSALTALTSGAGNIAIGYQTLDAVTTGTNNIAIGYAAADSVLAGHDSNIAIGTNSMGGTHESNASTKNIAIGRDTMTGAMNDCDDNIAIGYTAMQALTEGTDNVIVGSQAGVAITIGHDNVAIGMGAFAASAGADECIAIGRSALAALNHNTSADGTIGIGYQALNALTSGGQNTAVGNNAGLYNVTGSQNTYLGYNAGLGVSGQSAANNVGIGAYALNLIRTGTDNVVVGLNAMADLNSGNNAGASSQNVVIGAVAGGGAWANTQTDGIVAIGYQAMDGALDNVDGTVAIGSGALGALTSGAGNTAIGYQAGDDLTDGTHNTILGYQAGDTLLGGTSFNVIVGSGAMGGSSSSAGSDYNVAVGYRAMGTGARNNADNNVAVGKDALLSITTGGNNVAVGKNTADAITSGSQNIFIGVDAGHATTDVDYAVIIGHEAGYAVMDSGADGSVGIGAGTLQALTEGQGNVAVGRNALLAAIDSDYNTAVGHQALTAMTGTAGTTGNTAVGYQSAGSMTIGRYNTAVGKHALETEGVGDRSTAIGYEALHSQASNTNNEITGNTGLGYGTGYYNVTGTNNTFVGYNAAAGQSGQSNSNTTAVGKDALLAVTTGSGNTAVGLQAGDSVTDGTYNVLIGYQSGTEANNFSTGDECTMIGSFTDASGTNGQNQIVIGYDATGQADDSVTLGNASVTAVYMASDSGALVHCAGIQFPATQVANAGANVFDDYEEGTWATTGGAVNGITMDVASSSGAYTKIGQQVFIWCLVTFGAHTADGNASYTGSVPFTPKSGTYAEGKIGHTDSGVDGGFVEIRNGEAFFRYGKSTGTYAYITRAESASKYFVFSLSYIAA